MGRDEPADRWATSAVLTAPAIDSTFHAVTINTGAVALTPGKQYVLFFTTPPNAALANYSFGILSNDEYAGGMFVYNNNGDIVADLSTTSWSIQSQDLAFIAKLIAALSPFLPADAKVNAVAVAKAVDAYLAGGGATTPGIAALFGLIGSPTALEAAVAQLAGENATGAQVVGRQLTSEFLNLMLSRIGSGGGTPSANPLQYAAAIPKSGAVQVLTALDPGGVGDTANVWASGWGEWQSRADAGHNDLGLRTFGVAAGADYQPVANFTTGGALSVGRGSWTIANGLGGGDATSLQAGLYGKKTAGPVYIAASLAAGYQFTHTSRTVTVNGTDVLEANYGSFVFGGRVEGGYAFDTQVATVTPFAAAEVTGFNSPAYSETATSGSNQFALAIAANTTVAVRTELGIAAEKTITSSAGTDMSLTAKIAWVHDFAGSPSLAASFVTLPGLTGTVTGAAPNPNYALFSAGISGEVAPDWSGKLQLDGELGVGRRAIAASLSLRHPL